MNPNQQYDTELKLGQNRGKPRIWIEGRALANAGFLPGHKFSATFAPNHITLTRIVTGDPLPTDRTVSGKTKESGPHPIIDMNTAELDKWLPGIARIAVRMEYGRITITPARTILQAAARVATALAVGLFVGGGLLTQAAKAAGFTTVAANEVCESYVEIHDANHGGDMMHSSIEQARFEDIVPRHGRIGLLHAGIPCEPYSVIRRNAGDNVKVDKKLPPEAHELGDMTYWTLRAIELVNPYDVVIEQVPAYLESGSGHVLQHVLRRMGYLVEARVFNASEYGSVTKRRRAVVVATMRESINWPAIETAQAAPLASILHAPDDVRCEWFTRETESKQWLFDHWEKQTEKGNGFASNLIHYTDAHVGTIKKRYFAGQGDNPVVVHPTDVTKYRWLTLDEVKAIMGLPEGYDLGETKTNAGEVLGQGVEVGLFTRIIQSVTRSVNLQQNAA